MEAAQAKWNASAEAEEQARAERREKRAYWRRRRAEEHARAIAKLQPLAEQAVERAKLAEEAREARQRAQRAERTAEAAQAEVERLEAVAVHRAQVEQALAARRENPSYRAMEELLKELAPMEVEGGQQSLFLRSSSDEQIKLAEQWRAYRQLSLALEPFVLRTYEQAEYLRAAPSEREALVRRWRAERWRLIWRKARNGTANEEDIERWCSSLTMEERGLYDSYHEDSWSSFGQDDWREQA